MTTAIPPARTDEVRLGGFAVHIKRLDEQHSGFGGNKWYKLKYNIELARARGHDTILSFGGAWSNHIHALAHAGKEFGFKTIGVIRGEQGEKLTLTLEEAQHLGMTLDFVTREAYKMKDSEDFRMWLYERWGRVYIVPEGGANFNGINGAMEILSSADCANYDLVCVACGTGSTMAGLLLSSSGRTIIRGYSALKAPGLAEDQVRSHLTGFLGDREAADELMKSSQFDDRWHFGGFAKTTPALLDAMRQMEMELGFMLDPVYTAKMCFGLQRALEEGEVDRVCRILVIHSGGLQGRRSLGLTSA